MTCTLPPYQVTLYTAELARLTDLLAKLDVVIDAFMANPVQSYTLNTGQTQQTVNRGNIGNIEAWRDRVFARLLVINDLLNCEPSAVYVRPGW